MAPRTRFDVEDASLRARPVRANRGARSSPTNRLRVLGRNAVGSVKRALQSVKFINPLNREMIDCDRRGSSGKRGEKVKGPAARNLAPQAERVWRDSGDAAVGQAGSLSQPGPAIGRKEVGSKCKAPIVALCTYFQADLVSAEA